MKLSSVFRKKKGKKSADHDSLDCQSFPVGFCPPKRDRSKSLFVPSSAPLITVEKCAELESPILFPDSMLKRRTSLAVISSTCELERRGAFSRRQYGSVELLPQVETSSDGNDLLRGRRFRVENGELFTDCGDMSQPNGTPALENPESQTRWYFKYFLGKVHQNYVALDCDKLPVFLSVVLCEVDGSCLPQYKAILWRKTGAQKIQLSHIPGKPLTVKNILTNFSHLSRLEKNPREVYAPEIQKNLLTLEEQEGAVNFKFGVLYAKAGQTSDDEMFSNEKGSREFDRFLSLLGNKIRLKGWDKYRGGLDVKGDMTGSYSVHTIFEGHEIMFHVSTLLPFSKDNKQQVERKRHIGNDIVNIIFLDGGPEEIAVFSPSWVRSQFTHIFALVTYSATEDYYRLHVFSEESVPLFGPSLPSPPVFGDYNTFREFLLVKLINGEKAACNTPIFSQKRERTLEMLLRDVYADYMPETKGSLQRRAFSEGIAEGARGSKRKEETRQIEFVRIGQALKLDTIVRGDAPTNLAATGLSKKSPWEPQCFYPDFPREVICGDSWGDNRLVLGTEAGVYVIDENGSQKLIFDRSVQIKQLTVVEAHGILLFRTDRGRDSRLHVFRLSAFEKDTMGSEPAAFNRHGLKLHRIEKTKGTHLYATSKQGGSHLKVVVCVGRKLFLLQWRHSTAWTAWCPAADTDTVDGFLFMKEISISDPPSVVSFVNSQTTFHSFEASDGYICVGYRRQFDLISERTGEMERLHSVDSKWSHLVAALDVYEDDEPQILLCYNNSCHFHKLEQENSHSELDFQWNSVPENIVCAFPYILAFTQDSIEIRLVVNGNLIQTMVMPRLTLITSKGDVFFSTTAPEIHQIRPERMKSERGERDNACSPPVSPHACIDGRPVRIYRVQINSRSPSEPKLSSPPYGTPTSVRSGFGSDSHRGARSENLIRKTSKKDLRIMGLENAAAESVGSPKRGYLCRSSTATTCSSSACSPIRSPTPPSSNSSSPRFRPPRRLSLMAEDALDLCNRGPFLLSPPPSPKLFVNSNPTMHGSVQMIFQTTGVSS